MSNATHDSRNDSGNNRRRRSRGGANRNRNNQNRGERGDRDNRHPQAHRHQNQRAEEFRPQAPRTRSAPVKLSLWQKILKAIGLYKDPAPQGRRSHEQPKGQEAKAPKSNTRNARSNDGEARPAREPREAREQREPREAREPRERREGEGRQDRNRGNRGGDRPRGGDPKTVESTRVYVGNLSYDVTEQDLQELFKGVGPVRNVEIVYNRTTHRSKGYGFVEMLRKDEAERAVEVFHDQPFMGRKMNVSGAKSKGQDEREDKEPAVEAEPKRVVLAPVNPPAVASQVEGGGEPGLEEIPDSPELPEGHEVSSVSAADLEAKYSFDEPEEKKDQA